MSSIEMQTQARRRPVVFFVGALGGGLLAALVVGTIAGLLLRSDKMAVNAGIGAALGMFMFSGSWLVRFVERPAKQAGDRSAFLGSSAKRVCFGLLLIALGAWIFGLFMQRWRLDNYLYRAIEMPSYNVGIAALFWISSLCVVVFACGTLAYDSTLGRVFRWFRME